MGERLKELLEARGVEVGEKEIESFFDFTAAKRVSQGALRPCGCGVRARAGSTFRPGHDSKFYSTWRRWLDGELEDGDLSEATEDEIARRMKEGEDPFAHGAR